MEDIKWFPKVVINKTGNGFDALAGIKLKSILKGELLYPESYVKNEKIFDPLDPKSLHQSREVLLRALASWPSSLSLELRFTSLPNIIHKSNARLLISLFLQNSAIDEKNAKEELMSRYLTLIPLLNSYLPEAEFIPITDHMDFDLRWSPLLQTHAISIFRRNKEFLLSVPLVGSAIGFRETGKETSNDKLHVIHRFPWVPSYDDWSRLLNTIVNQLDPLQVIIRIRPAGFHKETINRFQKTIRICEDFLSREKESQVTLYKQASLIRDITLNRLASISETCFNVGVFILASHPIDKSLATILGQAITACSGESEYIKIFEGGFESANVEVQNAKDTHYFDEQEPFSISETACAFRLPSPPVYDIHSLPIKRARTSLAMLPGIKKLENKSIVLFSNEHRGTIQPVTVGIDDRLLHTFIIGQTGVGKSTLMESMILQDINAGRGLAVIDPHGELVDSILDKIPRERAKDVILFDTLDREHPLGFNLIECNNLYERDLIIDELYSTIDHIYDMQHTGGPIFENNFRGMLKLLIGDKTRENFIPTILDFSSCYQNRKFRTWLKKDIKDPQTLDFLEELERTSGEASIFNLSPYITSKFSRFINDATLRLIIGQETTSFDFDEIINCNKIFLVKLGKGRFGATVSALFANQLVSRFKLAAMKRGDMKPEHRKEFILYVDECHNLPPGNFMELLSEARKFKMGLVLATQYTAQLEESGIKKNSLLSAILGNVGTIIIFRLGKEDADGLAPVLFPCFSSLDIVGLSNWQGYVKMQFSDEYIPPFSFKTERDETPYDTSIASYIRKLSRDKYGRDVRDVDEKIQQRRQVWKKEDEDIN